MAWWERWSRSKANRQEPAASVRWQEAPAGCSAAIYQIFYSDETRAALDPGFLQLDNSANVRPDWREYHPIRAFLLNVPLDEQRFYGFLSPKFGQKGCVDSAGVHAFCEAHPDVDAVLFSPFIDLQAFFLNSFLQGEYFHPGLVEASTAFFSSIGYDVDLQSAVMDYRRSVFCNYFAAKPRFWRAWLDINERLYQAAEQGGAAAGLLTARTDHDGHEDVEFKIFIQERTADLLLATQPHWKAVAYPHSRPSALPLFSDDAALVFQADALKGAFLDTGNRQHLDEYRALLAQRGMPPAWPRVRAELIGRLGGRGGPEAPYPAGVG
jgi:hypothetical protein